MQAVDTNGHGTFIAGVVRNQAPAAEIRVEGFLPLGGAAYESEMVIQLGEALAGLILFQDGAKATTACKEERCRVQGVVVLPCGHGGGQSQSM